jgi:hypothetical protein
VIVEKSTLSACFLQALDKLKSIPNGGAEEAALLRSV